MLKSHAALRSVKWRQTPTTGHKRREGGSMATRERAIALAAQVREGRATRPARGMGRSWCGRAVRVESDRRESSSGLRVPNESVRPMSSH